MNQNNVCLIINDNVRRNLLIEQLQQLKNYKIIDNCDMAELLIIDNGLISPEINKTAVIIELDKGVIRLGDIIDRINYVISGRMQHIESNKEIIINMFTFRPNENCLIHNLSNELILLTDKERLLLRILYYAENNTLNRDNLLKLVWNYVDGIETHTLETHLYRLRQKLEKFNAQNIIIADGNGNYTLIV